MGSFFGTIENPLDIISPNSSYGGVQAGLPAFLSNIFKTIAVVAGIFALFQLITAGITYIGSQGDPKAVESAQNKIYMSLIGMVIITGSFAIAAIIGKLLFGEYTAILVPSIYGPGNLY